jgi:hypothetical protein
MTLVIKLFLITGSEVVTEEEEMERGSPSFIEVAKR